MLTCSVFDRRSQNKRLHHIIPGTAGCFLLRPPAAPVGYKTENTVAAGAGGELKVFLNIFAGFLKTPPTLEAVFTTPRAPQG
jgi:hypothetical protein